MDTYFFTEEWSGVNVWKQGADALDTPIFVEVFLYEKAAEVGAKRALENAILRAYLFCALRNGKLAA